MNLVHEVMTCIVGISNGTKVWMGADSCACNESEAYSLKEPKIFLKNNILFGVTGCLRGLQLLKYTNDWIPEHKDYKSDMEYLVTDFINAMKKVLDENGCSLAVDGEELQGDVYLIGYNGSLYTIENNYQVISTTENYEAIGSGSQFTKGYLYRLDYDEGVLFDSPRQWIIDALYCAEKFTTNVRNPFNIMETE